MTASRGDGNSQPLPEKHTTLQIDRRFSKQDMEHIQRGFAPKSMDDRWFIFYEGNTLYLHRSWTGHCIFEADFEKNDEEYIITQLRANRDEEQYRSVSDANDIDTFLGLLEIYLGVSRT